MLDLRCSVFGVRWILVRGSLVQVSLVFRWIYDRCSPNCRWISIGFSLDARYWQMCRNVVRVASDASKCRQSEVRCIKMSPNQMC